MLRKSRLVPGSAWLVYHVIRSCGSTIPDGQDGMYCDDLLVMTIGDGARPASRRMCAGLQYLKADQFGSRPSRSTFHPPSR